MLKYFDYFITLLHILSIIMVICMIIYLYLYLGYLPYFEHPEPTSVDSYNILSIITTIGGFSFLMNLPLIVYFGIRMIKNTVNKKNILYIKIFVIYYILSFIFHIIYTFRLIDWMAD